MTNTKVLCRAGAVTVEFALTASILIGVVFLSIEFVRISIINDAADHASYVGARKAMVLGATVSDVESEVQDHLGIYGIEGAQVIVSPNPLTDDANLVEVRVEIPVAENAWALPEAVAGNIVGRTRMVAEREAGDMNLAVAQAVALTQIEEEEEDD